MLLSTLDSISMTITIIWVSHGGFQGNEKVNAAEKSATRLPRIRLTKSDFTLVIRHRITNLWTSHWENQINTNKLAMLKPLPWPWDSSRQPHRCHKIYLTRLRIGHTRLTHSHLLSNLHPLSCDYCDTDDDTPLSVKHMFSCPSLIALLRQSF